MKTTPLRLLFIVFTCCISLSLRAQIITTIAGQGVSSNIGDSSSSFFAGVASPYGMCFDKKGNLYIADRGNHRIAKIDIFGVITTIAGTGVGEYNGDDRTALSAGLNYPTDVAIDDIGNIFIADYRNNRIRRIDTSGIIHTVAGNGQSGYNGDHIQGTAAKINHPNSVTFDTVGNIFFSDNENDRIRKVDTAGVITTIAGNGTRGSGHATALATDASLNRPTDIAFDKKGNLYIVEYFNNLIRKIDEDGMLKVVCGLGGVGYGGDGGPALSASIWAPSGIAIDDTGNIYFTDSHSNRVRKIDTAGTITLVAGSGAPGHSGDGGDARSAHLFTPQGIASDKYGNLYVSEDDGYIRYIFQQKILNNDNKINIFPNPAYDRVNVIVSSEKEEMVHMWIENIVGQKIREVLTKTNAVTPIDLDVTGVYFIYAVSAHEHWSGKLTVAR